MFLVGLIGAKAGNYTVIYSLDNDALDQSTLFFHTGDPNSAAVIQLTGMDTGEHSLFVLVEGRMGVKMEVAETVFEVKK